MPVRSHPTAKLVRSYLTVVMVLAAVAPTPRADAQEIAIKGGVALSSFLIEGPSPFETRITATTFGGHFRFKLGPIPLQPELHFVTRGAAIDDDESMRLEYMEIPLLLVLPVRAGDFEFFAVGGPMLALEARCRHIVEEGGLKTTFGCDPPQAPAFRRRAFDYGAIVGGGLGHRIGSGRLFLEGRHTWGMRNVYNGPDPIELRNRTFSIMLGYAMTWQPAEGY
jgi:hypothetical protein